MDGIGTPHHSVFADGISDRLHSSNSPNPLGMSNSEIYPLEDLQLDPLSPILHESFPSQYKDPFSPEEIASIDALLPEPELKDLSQTEGPMMCIPFEDRDDGGKVKIGAVNNERNEFPLAQQPANIFEKTDDVNEDVQTTFENDEKTTFNSQKCGLPHPENELVKHVPAGGLPHTPVVHPNQTRARDIVPIINTGKKNKSKTVRIKEPVKATSVRNVSHTPAKGSKMIRKTVRPNQVSPRSLNITDHYGQISHNITVGNVSMKSTADQQLEVQNRGNLLNEVSPHSCQALGVDEQSILEVKPQNTVPIDPAHVPQQAPTILTQETPQRPEQPKGRRKQRCATRDNNDDDANTPGEDENVEDSDDEEKGRKIKIEYITAKRNRQVTFLKRKNGVMKKAMELGTLTGCEIAIIVHNNDNQKTFEYSSEAMEKVLTNYAKYSGTLERRNTEKFNDLAGSKMNVNIPAKEIKLSKAALSAAAAAAARPKPYHKFDSSSPVEVVRVNGKRLASGETPPVIVGRRGQNARTVNRRANSAAERPQKFVRAAEDEETDEPGSKERDQCHGRSRQFPSSHEPSPLEDALPASWMIGNAEAPNPTTPIMARRSISTNLDDFVPVDFDMIRRELPPDMQVQNVEVSSETGQLQHVLQGADRTIPPLPTTEQVTRSTVAPVAEIADLPPGASMQPADGGIFAPCAAENIPITAGVIFSQETGIVMPPAVESLSSAAHVAPTVAAETIVHLENAVPPSINPNSAEVNTPIATRTILPSTVIKRPRTENTISPTSVIGPTWSRAECDGNFPSQNKTSSCHNATEMFLANAPPSVVVTNSSTEIEAAKPSIGGRFTSDVSECVGSHGNAKEPEERYSSTLPDDTSNPATWMGADLLPDRSAALEQVEKIVEAALMDDRHDDFDSLIALPPPAEGELDDFLADLDNVEDLASCPF